MPRQDDEDQDEDVPEPPARAAIRTGPLAPQIRTALDLPPAVKLSYREEAGGWLTVDGDFVGRNLPTILVAVRGLAPPRAGRANEARRLYLSDGTWVPRRLVLDADVEAAARGIAQVRRRQVRN